MRRKLLGLAVVLVALAAMVNALALESATIRGNAVSIPIVVSRSALIAIGPAATPDPDVSFDDSSGVATLTISDGLQPNSTYTFGPVFTITNNSATGNIDIDLTVDTSGTDISSITFVDTLTGSAFSGTTLAAGESVTLAMTIDVSATASLGTATPTITVSATTP